VKHRRYCSHTHEEEEEEGELKGVFWPWETVRMAKQCNCPKLYVMYNMRWGFGSNFLWVNYPCGSIQALKCNFKLKKRVGNTVPNKIIFRVV
jgi:hypothetical protein